MKKKSKKEIFEIFNLIGRQYESMLFRLKITSMFQDLKILWNNTYLRKLSTNSKISKLYISLEIGRHLYSDIFTFFFSVKPYSNDAWKFEALLKFFDFSITVFKTYKISKNRFVRCKVPSRTDHLALDTLYNILICKDQNYSATQNGENDEFARNFIVFVHGVRKDAQSWNRGNAIKREY